MRLRLSNSQKFFIALAFVFAIAFIDYRSILDRSREVETYDDMNYRLSSIRVSVVKLEYLLDMFIVAGRVEGTTIDLIQGDVEKLDESFNELLNNPEYIELIKKNDLLYEGIASIYDEWQTTKSEIVRLNASLSFEEQMLLHNAVDMNTVLVTEKAERIIGVIEECRKDLFEQTKEIALGSLIGFFVLAAAASLVFYKTVISRIKKAAHTAGRIRAGDLSARFRENTHSSTGLMGGELNRMIDSLAEERASRDGIASRLSAELAGRAVQLEAVNQLMTFAGLSLSLNDLFGFAANEAVTAGRADAAAVYIREGDVFRLKAFAGLDDAVVKGGGAIPAAGLMGAGAQSRTVSYHNLFEYPYQGLSGLLDSCGFKFLISAPISYNKETIGFLYAFFRQKSPLASEEFFAAIAAGAAVSAGHIGLFQGEHNQRRFIERILNQMPFGLAVFDRDGACIMSNGALKRVLGAEHKFNFTGEYRIFEDAVLSAQGMVTSIRKSYEGYATEFIINYNPSLNSKYNFSGPARRLRIRSFPLYDAGGEISNIVLIFEDISDTAEPSAEPGEPLQ